MNSTPIGASEIVTVKRMSLLDFCPWAMWSMLALVGVLLIMLVWRLIKVRTTAPGAFYFGLCGMLFLVPCTGIAHTMGQFVSRVPLMAEGLVDPRDLKEWDVFVSTGCNFVAFAAAVSTVFLALGLGLTALHRLMAGQRAVEVERGGGGACASGS